MVAKSTHQPTSLKFGIDEPLADRALRALLKHHESSSDEKEQLLGNDLDVQVQFTLTRIPGNPSAKPIRIEIPHPLVKVGSDAMEDDAEEYLQDASVCIIVKEESKPWVQEMIARFPSQLGCIKKVLGLQSLRTKHKSFQQKRELLDRFDVFLADDRILPMLTKALGGKFFEKKKQPVPVNVTRKEALPFAVEKCLRATFMHLSAGTCLTVKAGSTAMPAAKLIANIQSICAAVPTKVPRKWSNVRAISIKTSSSVALPIYNKTAEELEQIMKLAKEESKVTAEKAKNEDDGKKKRKAAANTPLAKALKKQKAAEEKVEAEEEVVPVKSAKKSSKKKKRKVETDEVKEETVVKESKTPKSSKKTKAESTDKEEVVKETKTPKSSKKKIKESTDEKEEVAATKEPTKTPKSSKKKKNQPEEEEAKKETKTPKSSKKNSKESVDEEKEEVVKEAKTPKSSKKRKTKADDTSAASSKKTPKNKGSSEEPAAKDANFIASRKFEGAKKGYVFNKGKFGKGYYKDVLPVVNLDWRDSLGKTPSRGGGGAGKSMTGRKKKKGGKSGRRSF